MNTFPPSELLLNSDGSIYHLHLLPQQLADKIILCGDPDRVTTIARHFDSRECEVQSREFHTITGTCHGKRITAVSTGIGCDNCDIVINELDALKNIDLHTRTLKSQLTQLDIVRIGTCGGLQPYTPVGTFICTEKSIGFDGLLNFYAGRNQVCDLDMEDAFTRHMHWSTLLPAPYVIDNNPQLLARIYDPALSMVKGLTIAAPGFFGPQGRRLRIPLADPGQNAKVETFEHNGHRITNYEMESSAIAGLSALLHHRALTVCLVIANRVAKEADANYKNQIDDLIAHVLERI